VDLGIAARRVSNLVITRRNLRLQLAGIESGHTRQSVHAFHKIGQPAGDHEVSAPLLERFHRSWSRARNGALQQHGDALAGQIGILFRSGQSEFALDDALRQYEPRVVESGLRDVLERLERIETRIQRCRQPIANRVQPH
jgi:hypothetical protein